MPAANTHFRRWITRFGRMPHIVVPVVILWLVSRLISGGDMRITLTFTRLLVATMFTCYVVWSFIKFLYYKDRPEPQAFTRRWQKIRASSFPSIHTAQATIILCFCVMMSKLLILEIFLWMLGSIFYVLMAHSRIILKKHFYLDVIFGTVLGLLIVAFMMWHMEAYLAIPYLFFSN